MARADPRRCARTPRARATPSSTRPTELDAGNPDELAGEYLRLHDRLPALCVVGGCCGTDERHIDAIAGAWLPAGREVAR